MVKTLTLMKILYYSTSLPLSKGMTWKIPKRLPLPELEVPSPSDASHGARWVEQSLQIRRRARSLPRSSEIVVKVFIGFNGCHEMVISKRDALRGGECVGHADCVLDLHSMISKEPILGFCR